jgi:two-component system chemotaxis response regulator CheY
MHTILIIDDDRSIIDMLSMILDLEGYHVTAASDGYEGLDRLQHHPVDLILSDLTMPLLDGAQLYQMLRADPRYQALPFILTTAALPPAALDTDPCGTFLAKPIQPETLLTTIARMLQQQDRARKEHLE